MHVLQHVGMIRSSRLFFAVVRASAPRRLLSTSFTITHPTDACGIPLQPTWSVNELLSSYPRPSISPSTLKHLHELSALIPPTEGSAEHINLTREIEDMVKIVESVKLVDTSAVVGKTGDIPDGRIWAEGTGIDIHLEGHEDEGVSGRALLDHAAKTSNGMYLVDADRRHVRK